MKIIVQGAAQKRKKAVQKILFACRGCGCVWEMQPDDKELEEDVYYGFGLLGPVVEKFQWSRTMCLSDGSTVDTGGYETRRI